MDIAEERKLTEEIQALRKEKELAEAFKRLQVNPDFRKVFQEYYLNSYALSLVLLKANSLATSEFKETLEFKLNSIAIFSRFLEEMQVSSDSVDERLAEAESQRINS